MTDRELLELAAKAAGVTHDGYSECACGDMYHPRDGESGLQIPFDVRVANPQIFDGSGAWNPLINDGDALRLAVKLPLEIRPYRLNVTAAGDGVWEEVSLGDYSAEEATRRAIVRAAAQIGKEMP